MKNPFRYFNSSPEIIRLTVMMYVRYPLSLRQVEDLLFERGIDIDTAVERVERVSHPAKLRTTLLRINPICCDSAFLSPPKHYGRNPIALVSPVLLVLHCRPMKWA
jgi:hypothetical protein